MRTVDDRLESREDPAVLGGELARVQDDRGDLALGHPDLDTPAGEHRVDRVVVAVHSDQRLLRDPRYPAVSTITAPSGRC